MSWFETSYDDARQTDFDPTTHWRMKDGKLVAITSMTESHLRNVLRMLHRATDVWAWRQAMTPPIGEMACDAHADWCGELAEKQPTDLILAGPYKVQARALVDEWDRRGFYRDTWRDDSFSVQLTRGIFNRIFPPKDPEMTYPLPQRIAMPDGMPGPREAVLDHATDYTEDPRPGEERPPRGQMFAYYLVGDRMVRIPLSVKGVKFSPDTLAANIATILLKL